MKIQGCYTALVTPFLQGKIDVSSLKHLVEEQIDASVSGIVPAGTTGESPTLTLKEHKEFISTVIEMVQGRCQIIAGTGGNSTEEALELTRFAKSAGADATLQVTPYYNKPTQEGLYRHFSTISEQGELPVILYNIPGRTGIPIAIETLERLIQHANIVGLKEAGGSVDRVSDILHQMDICILSGDDSLTMPMMAVGAKGVISVASNVIPREMVELTKAMKEKRLEDARVLHYRCYPLFKALFLETNPIPVKAALAIRGKIQEEYRLPLCPLSDTHRKTLNTVLTNFITE